MEKLRIMIFNVGYFTGISGSARDYLNFGYRYLYRNHKGKAVIMSALSKLLDREKPDITFLMETHHNHEFLEFLSKFPFSHTGNRYQKGGMLEVTPFYRRNSNSIISHREFKIDKNYLKSGRKRLIFHVQLDPITTLIFVHFAIGKEARAKQIAELESIIKEMPRVVIGGDFNTTRDVHKMVSFAKQNNLKIIDIKKSKTFPAHRPKRPLDFFVCSRNIKINNFKVIKDVKISDHLPVIIEIEV